MKGFQAAEEGPRREHPVLQNIEFLHYFFFVGNFTFLDSDPGLKPDPQIQLNPDFGPSPDQDPKHRKKEVGWEN